MKMVRPIERRCTSVAQAKASTARDFMAPAIRTLFESTYLAGLRKAGMPEE
jgi:hypothetical protein